MPAHDWTKVDAGIFHDFHTVWIGNIRSTLNNGLLPRGYYALAEQHAGNSIADILTLHTDIEPLTPTSLPPELDGGGTALAEALPKVRHRHFVEKPTLAERRRSIAIRHVSDHRLVALLEIVSNGNKDRAASVSAFTEKAAQSLNAGIHLLVVDLFPPGRNDLGGMHGAILQRLQNSDDVYDVPVSEPLTLAAYVAASRVEVFLEHLAVGANLPAMPLFLKRDRYINVPLESTYSAAYAGTPAVWREVLEK